MLKQVVPLFAQPLNEFIIVEIRSKLGKVPDPEAGQEFLGVSVEDNIDEEVVGTGGCW